MLVIPVFIPHLGCPHQCVFCNQNHITDRSSGCGAREDIGQTIAVWLARSPGRRPAQVAFYGGSFTCLPLANQRAMLRAVQPFLESGDVAEIRLSTRPDCIDAARCRLLQEHGVRVVELGIQSLTDSVLQLAKRGHTAAQARDAFRVLVAHGFEVGLQLMPGLPGETRRSFLRVVDEVIALQPSFVRLYPAVVIRDSELADMFARNEYRPLSVDGAMVLTARCCERLEEAGIRVVRMGLQPTDGLVDKVVSGPYHPAFGEMVRSRIWLRKIRRQLGTLQVGQSLHVQVSHREISAAVGLKKRNLTRLNELGFSGRFSLQADPELPKGQVRYVVS